MGKLKIIICLIILSMSIQLKGQYYTPAQINAITTTKTASEGDFYLDSVNRNYYIGITNGILCKIGDTIDERLDTIYVVGDSVAFVEGSKITYAKIGDQDWFKSNTSDVSDNISDNIYTNGRVGIGTNNPNKTLHVNGEVKIEGMSKGTKTDSIVVWNPVDSTLYYLPIDSIVPQVDELFFAAEYAGATFDTINGSTGNHFGYMTANNAGTPTFMNYYEWFSEETTNQDYDVILRFKVPMDFDGWVSTTIQNQAEPTASISVQVINITQGVNISPITNVTNGAFTASNLNLVTLNTNPSDVIVIIITMTSRGDAIVRAGDISLIFNK